MRHRFDAPQTLGQVLIEGVEIPAKTRYQLANLLEALQYIYTHPEWNQWVFSLLEEKITADKKRTGRRGMSLWEIFVLGQVRLCLNISYDQFHFMANDIVKLTQQPFIQQAHIVVGYSIQSGSGVTISPKPISICK